MSAGGRLPASARPTLAAKTNQESKSQKDSPRWCPGLRVLAWGGARSLMERGGAGYSAFFTDWIMMGSAGTSP